VKGVWLSAAVDVRLAKIVFGMLNLRLHERMQLVEKVFGCLCSMRRVTLHLKKVSLPHLC
jgi:hypothetical protein